MWGTGTLCEGLPQSLDAARVLEAEKKEASLWHVGDGDTV